MNSSVSQYKDQIVDLCKEFGVKELYAFGSVLTDRFGPESDVDFLMELDWNQEGAFSERYFNFKSALEELLSRRVDLVCYSAIKNPFFREEVEETKETIYAA